MKSPRPHQGTAICAIAAAVKGIINSPTGTGKSLMQSRSIVDDIITTPGETGVYVILSPRILLSNQLLNDVRSDLMDNQIECQYLVVNSDATENHDAEEIDRIQAGLAYRQTPITTSHGTVIDTYNKAKKEGVPLVISSTYHSAERIVMAGIPVKIVHCDEAHYLVTDQFHWITGDKFPADNKFFFTATLRETPSIAGQGMNNTAAFGGIVTQFLPIEMIEAGEIIRPRMHIVDMSSTVQGDEADGLAVAEAFTEHNSLTNVGAKLLVVAKGTEHLEGIVNHVRIQQLRRVRPQLSVYDISSEYGARINGEVVKRKAFLNSLRALTDSDEAIIVHIDILTEGIDVPGITGVMPMNAQGKARFLQTLGRATRLHPSDRTNLWGGVVEPEDTDELVKPYAYVVIPAYGDLGEDLKDNIRNMVAELRSYGFNPSEDVVIKEKRGKTVPVPIDMVTEPTRAVKGLLDFTGNVLHEIEEEEIALALLKECHEVKNLDNDALLASALTF